MLKLWGKEEVAALDRVLGSALSGAGWASCHGTNSGAPCGAGQRRLVLGPKRLPAGSAEVELIAGCADEGERAGAGGARARD